MVTNGKKTIGLYIFTWFNSNYNWDEKNYENGGIGGSEVWAIRTSDELAKMGYSVYLFGNPKESHVSSTGVKYLSYELYESISEDLEFDFFIFSRIFPYNINKLKTNNIFLISHDPYIENMPIYFNDEIGKIKKIFYLSDYHKQILKEYHPYLPDSVFCYTRNGVDLSLYEKYGNVEKKNQMVCSSGNYRQARWITTNVFPLIKKEVPDFELVLCSYWDTFNESIYRQEGIKIIGDSNNQLTKDELAKAQCESKIWIYSNTHTYDLENRFSNETFCITALEAACAKSAIIVGNNSPFPQTLFGYNHMIGKELYPDSLTDIMTSDNRKEFAKQIADMAIKCLKDEDYRMSLVNETYEIGVKSSWENATEYIINELKKYQ